MTRDLAEKYRRAAGQKRERGREREMLGGYLGIPDESENSENELID